MVLNTIFSQVCRAIGNGSKAYNHFCEARSLSGLIYDEISEDAASAFLLLSGASRWFVEYSVTNQYLHIAMGIAKCLQTGKAKQVELFAEALLRRRDLTLSPLQRRDAILSVSDKLSKLSLNPEAETVPNFLQVLAHGIHLVDVIRPNVSIKDITFTDEEKAVAEGIISDVNKVEDSIGNNTMSQFMTFFIKIMKNFLLWKTGRMEDAFKSAFELVDLTKLQTVRNVTKGDGVMAVLLYTFLHATQCFEAAAAVYDYLLQLNEDNNYLAQNTQRYKFTDFLPILPALPPNYSAKLSPTPAPTAPSSFPTPSTSSVFFPTPQPPSPQPTMVSYPTTPTPAPSTPTPSSPQSTYFPVILPPPTPPANPPSPSPPPSPLDTTTAHSVFFPPSTSYAQFMPTSPPSFPNSAAQLPQTTTQFTTLQPDLTLSTHTPTPPRPPSPTLPPSPPLFDIFQDNQQFDDLLFNLSSPLPLSFEFDDQQLSTL